MYRKRGLIWSVEAIKHVDIQKKLNRRVSVFCVATGLPLTVAPLATGVRARANLGGNGWSPGGDQEAVRWLRMRGMGVVLQIIKQRLLPVPGFNITARLLPEYPQRQLKNVKHDLKGY